MKNKRPDQTLHKGRNRNGGQAHKKIFKIKSLRKSNPWDPSTYLIEYRKLRRLTMTSVW